MTPRNDDAIEQHDHSTPDTEMGGPAAQAGASSGRDSKGRFTRGNKGGPGSPFNRRVAALRQLLLERVSDDDLAAIVDRLVQQAREGDLAAVKLVLSYTVGKPLPAVDPDRVDVDEFKLFQEEARTGEEFMRPLKAMPAGMACDMLRAILPALLQDYMRMGAEMFAQHQSDQQEASAAAPQQPSSDTAPTGATSPVEVGEVSQGHSERETASHRRAARRKAKSAKEPASQDTTAPQTSAPGPELPSVAQILSLLPLLLPGAAPEPDPSAQDTGTPMQTVKRAANPAP
jgi:hypothetical protein